MSNPYLSALEELGAIPNFWCSEEYFEKAGITVIESEEWVFALDGDSYLLPPLPLVSPFEELPPQAKIWNGYPDQPELRWIDAKFHVSEQFDLNYVYEPGKVVSLSGGDKKVFRKNVRKFPQRLGKELRYLPWDAAGEVLGVARLLEQVRELSTTWLSSKRSADGEAYERDIIIRYVVRGDNRLVLLDEDGEVWGIDIWDENYQHINFRYSISRNEPFLNEYQRLQFYLKMNSEKPNKNVNDGGNLGDDGLAAFKERLGPSFAFPIFSYTPKKYKLNRRKSWK